MKAELIADADIAGRKKLYIKEFNGTYFSHPLHFHQFYELTWIQEGYGKVIVGDLISDFSKGELILHGEGLPHLWKCDADFYLPGGGRQTRSISVYFPRSLLEHIVDDERTLATSNELMNRCRRGMRIAGVTKSKITELIERMTGSKGFEQLACFLMIWNHLINSDEYELLAGVAYKNIHDSSDIKRFNDVYEFLLNNFRKNIMLDEVAKICHLTPSAFCRYFKARTKKSFSHFLNEIRIGHACRLLQQESYTIKDIGYECGYNNAVNFYKFFKRITGITPREYQKAVNAV